MAHEPFTTIASPADAFELVGTVARVLSGGLPADETLSAVADLLRVRLGRESVAIWRRDGSASTFGAVASPPRLAAAVSLDDLPALDANAVRLSLVHGGLRLGVLELAPHPPASQTEVLEVLRTQLAPFLDTMTLAEDLALEVASRSREIAEHRRFTSLVIDSLPVGIYVTDRDYRIQFWNRKRETGTQGLRRHDVVGRPVFEVLTRQDPDRLRADFDRVFSSGQTLQRQTVVEAGGERRTYRLSRIPMRLDGEGITHVVTVGEDVTDARTAQHQLLQSEKLAAVGQLAAGVMHEINNPLATIAACAAAIEDRLGAGADSAVPEYLEIIDKEVQRCTRIVDGLLEFSRPSALALPKAAVDLNTLVDRTLFLLKHHKRFKRLTVETDLAPASLHVVGNAEQLIQVMMAILLNAVDAMYDGGMLTVRSGIDDGGTVHVEIGDTGPGILPTELGKIFEPFYTTKPSGQGTGLGLSIAYGIAQDHGGRIEVSSQVGEGSVFRLLLPRAGAEAG